MLVVHTVCHLPVHYQYPKQIVKWSREARNETIALAHAVVFMKVHIGSEVLPLIFGTDASGGSSVPGDHGGYGTS